MRKNLRKLLERRTARRDLREQCQAASEREEQKTPTRIEIINWLLQQTNHRRYLEIGVRNPENCFDHINADFKVSVDPGVEATVNKATVKLTSDEFFEQLNSGQLSLEHSQFDVIFIDGLHLADQAWRDIQNSMQIIAETGFVVLHDCNPPTRFHSRENVDEENPAGGFWNGTTWKAFQRFRTESDRNSYVINSDWGVGVIENHRTSTSPRPPASLNPFYEFAVFEQHRQEILNLVEFSALQQARD